MRIILVALTLVLMPGPSFAACACRCVEGVSEGRCSSPTEMPPICQNLCLPSLELPGAPSRGPDLGAIETEEAEDASRGLIPKDYRPQP